MVLILIIDMMFLIIITYVLLCGVIMHFATHITLRNNCFHFISLNRFLSIT